MKLSKRDREAFAKLDAIYARLPTISCKRKCSIACGPVPLTDLEARRLQLAAHQKPRTIPLTMVPPGEAKARPVERCIYLRREVACGVYDVRPLICRAWGLVKMLSCPHGCAPSRWLGDLEFLELARAVERIGGGRVLRTSPEGLVHFDGDSYNRIAAAKAGAELAGAARSPEQIEANAERTRNLRALYGGRVVVAIEHD